MILRQRSRRLLAVQLLLTLILNTVAFAAPSAPGEQGVVTRVYDGDTLEIVPFGKVRLIGIDCPERRDNPARDRKFTRLGIDPVRLRSIHRAAREYNIRRVQGKTVSVRPGDPHHDRHGRLLAYVYLPDGRLLNRLLLREGLAVVYRRFDFALKSEYLKTERAAVRSGKGLWATVTP